LFIITDYDVRFIAKRSSVGSHLLVPQYGNVTIVTLFDSFLYMVTPVFFSNFTAVSLHTLKCS